MFQPTGDRRLEENLLPTSGVVAMACLALLHGRGAAQLLVVCDADIIQAAAPVEAAVAIAGRRVCLRDASLQVLDRSAIPVAVALTKLLGLEMFVAQLVPRDDRFEGRLTVRAPLFVAATEVVRGPSLLARSPARFETALSSFTRRSSVRRSASAINSSPRTGDPPESLK